MRHKRPGIVFNFRWLKFKCARLNDGNIQRFIDAAALFQVNRRRFVDSLTCVYYHFFPVSFSFLLRLVIFFIIFIWKREYINKTYKCWR